jgi:hypothetical protein
VTGIVYLRWRRIVPGSGLNDVFLRGEPMIELNGKGCRVRVIADSIANLPNNKARISTLELRYWRAIHAEAKTHRIISLGGEEYALTQDESIMSATELSRNASSSRAIPVAKMIEQVRNDPAGPIHWGANQPGMQAQAEASERVVLEEYEQFDNPSDQPLHLLGAVEYTPQEAWRQAAYRAADVAEAYMKAGYHKQVVNRLLEPFQYISVIVTATEWDNFFALRDHADAQPEIADLARTMKAALAKSTPIKRNNDRGDPNSWHLPYVLDSERKRYRVDVLQALSTARNARVSYLTHDGAEPRPEKDLELYERLVGAEPLHASPTEHIAAPLARGDEQHKNFKGWHQYRGDVEIRIARAKKSAPTFYFDTYRPEEAPFAVRA